MIHHHYLRLCLRMLEAGGVSRPAAIRAGAADLVIDTDHDGMPHLPATSFAGALRARVRAEKPDREDAWFGFVRGDTVAASGIWVLGSRLVDSEGKLVTEQPKTEQVTTTAINRHSGGAMVNTLRTVEMLPQDTRFEVYLRWDGVTDADVADLVTCLSGWVPLIGRATSTGHGACTVESVHTGMLDLAKPDGRLVWLTTSGPALVRAVASTPLNVSSGTPDEVGYAVTFRTTDGPLRFSNNSDGELPSHLLPGASIKGVIRSRMEFILRSVGMIKESDCGGVGCGDCLVCAVFGHSVRRAVKAPSVGQRARLRVADASVVGTVRKRSHAPLDRWTGGVAAASKDEPRVAIAGSRRGLLHTVEGIEDGEFTVKFIGRLPDDLKAGFESLLVLVLKDIEDGLVGFGRGTTRGCGTVTVAPVPVPDESGSLPELAKAREWLRDALKSKTDTRGDSA